MISGMPLPLLGITNQIIRSCHCSGELLGLSFMEKFGFIFAMTERIVELGAPSGLVEDIFKIGFSYHFTFQTHVPSCEACVERINAAADAMVWEEVISTNQNT